MADTREPKHLVLLCTAMYELEFALRLRAGLGHRGWTIVVVTNLISVWFKTRREGVDCVLLHVSRQDDEAPEFPIEGTHEGRLGVLSERRARRYARSAWAGLNAACRRFAVAGVLQWNGQGLAGQVAAAFARRRRLAVAFVELGNVGGKTFVDPEGVSGGALVARRPDILDRYEVSEDEIARWRDALVHQGADRQPIPQARNLGRINPWYPINVLGGALLGLPAPAAPGLWLRLRTRIALLNRVEAPDLLPDPPYVFLALQVSSDTNLLLFSDHDLPSALRAAELRAMERGVPLVVKPHPAERDVGLMREIQARCEAKGHIWTGANVIPLILGADEVVTVNSTVGLTARALDRPLIVLGRSVYGGFDARRAAVFALRHLVDIDPFDTAPAGQAGVDQLLDRMTLCPDQTDAKAFNPSLRSAIRS